MKHLEEVQMNYTIHLSFAGVLALKLFLLSLTALVHGIFPSILVHSVSDKIKSMSENFQEEALQRNPH